MDIFKKQIKQAFPQEILNIRCPKGREIASLVLIGENHLQDTELVEMITNFRNANRECFLTEFVATNERTRDWLDVAVVKNPARAFFAIYAPNNTLVGHVGAIHRGDSLEYDYFILDPRVRGAFSAKQLARLFLVSICRACGLSLIFGNVRSSNHSARAFHRATGFSEVAEIPLKRVVDSKGEVAFRPLESDEEVAMHLVRIETDCEVLSAIAFRNLETKTNKL